jgi:type IV pilus assembly protein PilY1
MQFTSLSVLLTLLVYILRPRKALRILFIAVVSTICLAGNLNAYIMEAGFESGGYSPFDSQSTGTNDSVTYTTAKAHSGSYSAKCTIDTTSSAKATLMKSVASTPTKLYMRAYFYLATNFSTSDHVDLMQFLSNWYPIIQVRIKNDNKLYLWNHGAGQVYGPGNGYTVSKGAWHAIELMVDTAAGETRLWLDGNLDIEKTGMTNNLSKPLDYVSAGIYDATPANEANTIYLDDAVIDTQYIGAGGALSVTPASLSVFVGNNATVAINGGTGPYSASGFDSAIDANITGTTLTVTGVSNGNTTVTVEDSAGGIALVDVTVTTALTVTPTNVNLYLSEGADEASATISGGKTSYTATSGNSAVATVKVTGSTVTITGVGAGTVTITITDALDNHVYVTAVVGDSISSGLGDCPAPPFAMEGTSPNVLIVFDTSGSMNEDDGDGVTRFDEAKQAVLSLVAANKNIRFGLMRLDGTGWVDEVRPGGLDGKHNAIKGGKLLVPTGFTGGFATSADYIINYINTHMPAGVYDYWSDAGIAHATDLAETLVDAGRYFATVVDSDNNRVGKGPAGFGYYKEGTDYTFYYDADHDGDLDPFLASLTDDYGNPIDTTSPLQHSCEQAFVIMFTDGQANTDNDWDLVTDYIGDYDGDNDPLDCKRADPEVIRPGISDPNDSNYGMPLNGAVYPCDTRESSNLEDEFGQARYLDDVAKFLYDHDMRSDIPGMQNVITYTIGLYHGDDLLDQAAEKGGGQYFTASSLDELSNALQAAIEDIKMHVASGTAVSTITTSSSTPDYLIRAKFLPAESWEGYLERFTLPYAPETEGYGHDWEAGSELNARVSANGYADRKIWTFLNSQNPKKQRFISADGAVKTHLVDVWGLGGNPAEAADIINYIRGDQTYDGVKYKDRNGWLLGDIIYSTPISVGTPRAWLFGSEINHPENASYADFRTAYEGRKTMIYVGANDGMLHAFDNDTGAEEWAFIPENLHGKLLKLTEENCHQYFVDLTPAAADVWNGSKWMTVLIGGDRLGGQEYFALDVSEPSDMNDPSLPTALWDKIPFIGRMSSTVPAIGKVKANNGAVNSWAAIVTSGYTSTDLTGEIAALNIANGEKLDIWKIGAGWDDDRNTQAKAADSPYYTLSSPAALDSDMDGYLDLIYAGDTEGTLWKFYYDYEDKGWKRVALFNATDAGGHAQAITATPALAFSNGGRSLRVYFGTGKYIEESDKANSIQNAFYCLIEQRQYPGNANNGHFTGTAIIDKADLGNLTTIVYRTQFDDAANEAVKTDALANGWYFYLDHQPGNPAERVLDRALIAAKYVFFASFAPNQDVCGFGGDARLYAVEYITGTVDEHEQPLENVASGKRYEEIGLGIPSRPVYYLDPTTLKTTAFIQTSDSSIPKPNLDLEDRSLRIQTWQTSW